MPIMVPRVQFAIKSYLSRGAAFEFLFALRLRSDRPTTPRGHTLSTLGRRTPSARRGGRPGDTADRRGTQESRDVGYMTREPKSETGFVSEWARRRETAINSEGKLKDKFITAVSGKLNLGCR